jgi:hypothetical protein
MRGGRLFASCLLGALAACSTPTQPKPPDDPGPATAPVIRSITVPSSRVEAGLDVAITAVVEDAETPLTELSYTWSASAGTITGTGTTATWRMPDGITAGVDVVITLTVVDTYDALVGNTIVQRQFTVVGTSSAFRVHDSEAELKELARHFLIDLFGNSTIPPEACLVDFTTIGRCAAGKSAELSDIQDHREVVVVLSAVVYAQSVEFFGSAEARVTTEARFDDRYLNPAPGQPEFDYTHADFYLTAVYDGGRWWLCESTWGNERGRSAYLALLRAKASRGGNK